MTSVTPIEEDKYADIRTGDVILLSSITTFAIFVKWAAASEFNHCAVAVRLDEAKLPEVHIKRKNGLLALIEFNGDDYENLLTGNIHHGNRLIRMSDMVKKYKRISYRKMHSYLYNNEFKEKVKNFIIKYCNTIVKMNVVTPVLSVAFGLELKNDDIDEHPSFCSELTAKFYGDILKGSIKTNYKNLLPHHFSSNKYNHLFDTKVINVKNEPHPVMDFFHSKLFLIIFFLILIIIFILFVIIGTKVYKRYRIKK